MASNIKIVVTDTPPLVTLAAAKSLDYLLYPSLPVIIPDAVFHEATASSGLLGAEQILTWYRTNFDKVRIEPTQAFQNETTLLELGRGTGRLPRDLGDRASMEVIRDRNLIKDNERALLLSDDKDISRLVFNPEKVLLTSTRDFLRYLEETQRIQSADAVIEMAEQAGRHPAKHDLWSEHDPDVREAIKSILRNAP